MNVLVTGATGFLGSRLVRRLLEVGHRVGIIARDTSSYGQIADLLPRLAVHVVDASPDSVRHAVAGAEPEVVFRLATYFARDHQAQDLGPMLESNLGFPLRLVDAMAREGLRRLVNTGSAWEFFESPDYRPVCLHSAMKKAFESLVAYFVDVGAIDCITLMMHDSYGPDDPRQKIFSIVRRHAGRTDPLKLTGGEQFVDFVHVDDIVAAYIAAGERLGEPRPTCRHEVYSVSGGNPVTLRAAVEAYLRYADLELSIEWGGRAYHEREVMKPWTGPWLPGWCPKVDLSTGLRLLARADAVTAENHTGCVSV